MGKSECLSELIRITEDAMAVENLHVRYNLQFSPDGVIGSISYRNVADMERSLGQWRSDLEALH